LYPHPKGLPFKRSLRELAATYLERFIQEGATGHDSFEDAIASLDLAKLKISKGPSFGLD
jgi:RNA exonuclease 1